MNNDELMHYGVLGMKWGVRRAVNSNPNVQVARKQRDKDFNAAYKAAKRTKSIAITKQGKAKKAAREKEYSKAYDKYNASSKKYESAKKQAKKEATKNIEGGFSAKAKRNIANMSTGKAVTQSLLMGSYGSAVYNNVRTKGYSRGKAVGTAILANGVNNMTLGSLSRAAKRSR